MTASAKRYLAEALGTFALVFPGIGAVMIKDISGGGMSHAGPVPLCIFLRAPGCCGEPISS